MKGSIRYLENFVINILSRQAVLLLLLVIPLPFLSACVPSAVTRPPGAGNGDYQSKIFRPQSKALYAYSRFRLLGADNRWPEATGALEDAFRLDPASDYLPLVLARAYVHGEEPRKAIAVLKSLLERFPDDIDAHELLGDIHADQGNLLAALDCFDRAFQLAPERETLNLRIALTLARLKRTDEAIRILEELPAKGAETIAVRLYLAGFYLEKDLTDKALSVYQDILAQEPDQPQALLDYGKLLEVRSPDQAVKHYQQALMRNPQAAPLRQRLAQLYLLQGQLDAALEQFQLVNRQYPHNPPIISRIALLQLELENWDEAAAGFRQLIESGDIQEQDRHRFYLALALTGAGQDEEAMTLLGAVPTQSAVYPEAVLQLAYLFNRNSRPDDALNVLRRALAAGVQRPDFYYYLVAFLGDLKRFEDAQKVAGEGLGRCPEDVRLLYQAGILQEKTGQRLAAVKTMEAVLALDPDHADALNFLAYSQTEQGGDLEQALEWALRAAKLNRTGYVVDTLGWVYFKLGRYADSRTQLEDAARLQPDDAVIMEHLGDLYRVLELWDQAIEAYRRSLSIDPQAEAVEKKLKHLLERETL